MRVFCAKNEATQSLEIGMIHDELHEFFPDSFTLMFFSDNHIT